jgi:hypothetical protein
VGRLVRDEAGELRLECCRRRWRSIGEAYAAEAYGEDRRRTNIEIAVWLRRLAHELGSFKPESVAVPTLPDDASAHAHRARAGFALLIGLRWADGPRRPVAFSVRFCAAWCSLPIRAASAGINELLDRAVLWQENAGDNSRLRLYLPGDLGESLPPGLDEAIDAFFGRTIVAFPGAYEEAGG